VRARSRVVKGRAEYEFFTARKMYEDEVDAILTAQKQHHPQLTDQVCHELKEIIFYMRPFKPEPPGKCRFEPGEPAARLALPLVQKFRIWQEVNNLEIEDGADGGYVLDLKDRTKIVESLLLTKRNTFNYIRKMLRLADDCRFNLESGRKPGAARR
jgi:CRISPR-associated endonuclease Csn1